MDCLKSVSDCAPPSCDILSSSRVSAGQSSVAVLSALDLRCRRAVACEFLALSTSNNTALFSGLQKRYLFLKKWLTFSEVPVCPDGVRSSFRAADLT